MAWRLQFHTASHYLDFEWGKRETATSDQPDMVVDTQPPTREDAEQRIGFHMVGDGLGFVTGDV